MQDKPRALVALSEDRQWLCGICPTGQFIVAKFSEGDFDNEWGYWPTGWGTCDKAAVIEDTGQDAHAVLADFLARRK